MKRHRNGSAELARARAQMEYVRKDAGEALRIAVENLIHDRATTTRDVEKYARQVAKANDALYEIDSVPTRPMSRFYPGASKRSGQRLGRLLSTRRPRKNSRKGGRRRTRKR